jgi:hypothetical protein
MAQDITSYEPIFIDTFNFTNEEEICSIIRILLNGESIFEIQDFKNILKEHIKSIIDNREFIANPIADGKNIDFYSSYTYGITKEDFLNKPMLWFTPCIEQAMAFPFDISKNEQRRYPMHFIKFNFSRQKQFRPTFLISSNPKNINIFTPIFFNDKIISNRIIKYILINVFHMEDHEDTLNIGLSTEYNNRILYILDAINRIYAGHFIINGYINLQDQCEFAMLYTKYFIKDSSIKIYSYDKLLYKDVYIVKFSDLSYDAMFYNSIDEKVCNDVKRKIGTNNINYIQGQNINYLKCPNNLTFTLINIEDEFDIITYNCNGFHPQILDLYNKYLKKYLKYKQKYLKLKNKIKL